MAHMKSYQSTKYHFLQDFEPCKNCARIHTNLAQIARMKIILARQCKTKTLLYLARKMQDLVRSCEDVLPRQPDLYDTFFIRYVTCAIYVRMVLYYSSHPPTLPLGTCIYTVLRRRREKPLQITHSIISHIYLSLLPYSFFMNVQVILFVTHSLYIFDAMCENQHVLLVGAHSLLSRWKAVRVPRLPPAHSFIYSWKSSLPSQLFSQVYKHSRTSYSILLFIQAANGRAHP